MHLIISQFYLNARKISLHELLCPDKYFENKFGHFKILEFCPSNII